MAEEADDAPTHVIDHVFVGSKAHARDREQLQQLKITHVLNVTPTKKLDPIAGVPNFFEKDKIFEYRRCPLFDNKAEDISGALDGCVAFIERAKFYGRVFVHCSKGVSRSVSMVIAYLIKIREMPYADALQLVQTKRRVAQPNPSFEKQLIAYSERLERLRKRMALDGADKTANAPAGPTPRPAPEAASIGPQLPPYLMKSRSTCSDGDIASEEEKKEASASGDGTSSSPVTIGPTVPGVIKRKRDGVSESHEKTTKQKIRVIGPSRPPASEK